MVSMRNPSPLPLHLRGGPVTQQMLVDAGFSRDRIRRRDMVRLHLGRYAHRDAFGGPEPPESLRSAVLLARSMPDCWVSHTTAARLHGLLLPWRLESDQAVHLSQPLGTARRIRRAGVRSHRVRLEPEDVVTRWGAATTGAARTWLDLAGGASVEDLVILGDQLVRRPYVRFEGRSSPLLSPAELRGVTHRYSRVRGRPRAVEALGLIRVGADSAAETLLRLALVGAGLPEPQLQVPADPSDPRSPCADLGYPSLGIVIQYDGATHAEVSQYRRDAHRDNAFTALGWTVLRFTGDDFRGGFRRATVQVRALLAAHQRSGGRSAAQ